MLCWLTCPGSQGTAVLYPSFNPSQTTVLADPPPQLAPGPNVTVSPGETAILSCQVLGDDVPYNLTWVRDWRALPATAGRVTQLHDLSLEVSNVTTGDGGQYQCVASNVNGVTRASTWLLVRGEAHPTLAGPLAQNSTLCSLGTA